MNDYNSLLIEISKKGRCAYSLPKLDVEDVNVESIIEDKYLRKEESNEEFKIPLQCHMA